jgi:hypothetical protein
VYLARTVGAPDPTTINNASSWEFYGGGQGSAAVWVPDVSAAKPLFVWPGRTGVVTCSYHATLNKYIMVVSTPTDGCSTVGNFGGCCDARSVQRPPSLFSPTNQLGVGRAPSDVGTMGQGSHPASPDMSLDSPPTSHVVTTQSFAMLSHPMPST